MDMYSRNQYLERLQRTYFQAKSRKERTSILNEYCQNTSQNRKYVLRKINHYDFSTPKKRKKRKQIYDVDVKVALARIWEIFDYPCGQRLAPLLKTEVNKLCQLGEISITKEVVKKLKNISPVTIDRKLKHQREVLLLSRKRGHPRAKSLLYKKIPVRLNDWDTSIVGNLGIDLVEHCGSSNSGEYIHTLSVTDISTGWWEGQGIMSRGQYPTLEALKEIRERTPFNWLEIHSDNDSAFINAHLFKYCQQESLKFSRSRPNKKNDNAYVEQKNWTHVKKIFGYFRYDTLEELEIMNDLYENELRLYKNFFSPVMKLIKKERVGGKVRRRYDIAQTPYQRLMKSGQITKETQKRLKDIYDSLNPAELKRNIETKLQQLYQTYEEKMKGEEVCPLKRQKPRIVTNYMTQQEIVSINLTNDLVVRMRIGAGKSTIARQGFSSA